MFTTLVVLLAVLFAVASAANIHDRKYYEEKFYNWMQEHKVRPDNGDHFLHMLTNFANNDDFIDNHNAKKLSYTVGHNKYSHMNSEEFKEYMNLKKFDKPEPSANVFSGNNATAPSSVDWVSAGAVTGVKDQGQCGSCWSFSTTGSLEGAYKLKYGTLKSFSEQNLVSCDNFKHGGKDLGCNGGLYDSAYAWIQKNGGLCSEEDWAYTSGTTRKNGDCDLDQCTKDSKAAIQSWTDIKATDDALMSALAQQPVSVAIEADQQSFQLYKSGVFTGECGDSLDHAVLAVGYGTYTDGTDYYKVKNSWGTSWGMDGYILMERGGSDPKGKCGILTGPPAFPTL